MRSSDFGLEGTCFGPARCMARGGGTQPRILRVGMFFDGVTFKIMSDYYLHEHWRQARLSFAGIEALVRLHLQLATGATSVITDRHLFIGVAGSRAGQSRRCGLAPGFERALQMSGVQAHYLERNARGEKGVDTALTIEMLQLAWARKIDVAVLLATDGDFAPLAKAVRATGVTVVLLGFHLPHNRQPVCMSPLLTDAVSKTVDMIDLIERPPVAHRQIIDDLFYLRRGLPTSMPCCA